MMKRQIKIAVIITGLGIGGAETRQLTIARNINREKYHIDYFCIYSENNSLIPEFNKLGYNVRILKIFDYTRPFLFRISYLNILKLAHLLKQGEYDIVHTQLPHANTVGRIASLMAGKKSFIATICSMQKRKYSRIFWDKVLGKLSNKIMCVSDAVLSEDIKYTKLPRNKYIRIYNGIDTEKFSRAKVKTFSKLDFGFSIDTFIIGSVGRLNKQKNYETLIHAFNNFSKDKVNVGLVITGDGPERNNLVELVRKLGISNNVKFLGSQKDIPEVLSCYDIFVLSSLQEGLPNSILEAMSMELPIISTNVPAVREIIDHDIDGIMVPVQDSRLMSDAIQRLYLDKNFRRKLANNARNKVLMNFSQMNMINELQKMYDETN